MRHIGLAVGLVAASLGLLLVVACGGPAPTPTPDLQDVIVRELAAKYQATILGDEDITYTLQAQALLTTGKPTLFTGSVEDVFDRNGTIFVRFSSYDSLWSSFVFELECSPSMTTQMRDIMYGLSKGFITLDEANGLLRKMFVNAGHTNPDQAVKQLLVVERILTGKQFGPHVVVANIQVVSKAVIGLRASPLSEDEAEIEIYTSDTPFFARGTCIDIAYVGTN